MLLIFTFALVFVNVATLNAFSLHPAIAVRSQIQLLPSSLSTVVKQRETCSLFSKGQDDDGVGGDFSRRNIILSWLSDVSVVTAGLMLIYPESAMAEDSKRTVYLTGKTPQVLGQKPRDKNDYTGTRKDPNFLRSISDCKSQCENKLGPDGLYRSKESCLSDCQDICCTTYEQCTFAIVPRI